MLWIDFANSLARDPLGHVPPRDRLQKAGWLDKFLSDNGLEPTGALDPLALGELQALRDLLHRLAGTMAAGDHVDDADLRALNNVLASTPAHAEISRNDHAFELRLVPDAGPLARARFAIAASCAEFLASEDLTRIKLCENPDCLWIFFDATRSRTRRWCADSCGNLIKVRRFRERHAEKKGD